MLEYIIMLELSTILFILIARIYIYKQRVINLRELQDSQKIPFFQSVTDD